MAKKQLHIRASARTEAQLRELAEQWGTTITDVVSTAVDRMHREESKKMNRLADLIIKIQYDSSWGIWASTPFTPDSDARYGQRQFENGGLLDGKEFFADGMVIGDWFNAWFEDDEDGKGDSLLCQEAAEQMIAEWEEQR